MMNYVENGESQGQAQIPNNTGELGNGHGRPLQEGWQPMEKKRKLYTGKTPGDGTASESQTNHSQQSTIAQHDNMVTRRLGLNDMLSLQQQPGMMMAAGNPNMINLGAGGQDNNILQQQLFSLQNQAALAAVAVSTGMPPQQPDNNNHTHNSNGMITAGQGINQPSPAAQHTMQTQLAAWRQAISQNQMLVQSLGMSPHIFQNNGVPAPPFKSTLSALSPQAMMNQGMQSLRNNSMMLSNNGIIGDISAGNFAPIKPPEEDDPNLSGRKPSTLSMSCDDDSLSEYQCLVRKQIQLFEARKGEVASNAKGRNKPIVLGQVGIRCWHCSVLTPKHRAKGATYYPAKLNGLYQAAQSMASGHLCYHCLHIPQNLRQELLILRERKSSAGGGKKYWGDGVRVLGVLEDADGLRFKK